jgi:hypothetical protein
MPPEEKQKINVWIGSLWKQIESLEYNSPTKATIAAFEALVLQETLGSNQEALGSSQEREDFSTCFFIISSLLYFCSSQPSSF